MSKFAALALAVDQPARMTILHPVTGAPLCAADGAEAYIDLLSADSAAAKAHERAALARRLNRPKRAAKADERDIADAQETQVEFLATLTKGWRLVGLDGAVLDVPCTAENARELYREPAMAWLREQVDQFVADRAGFTKASPTS